MPSGRTHDQITYVVLPVVLGFTFGASRNLWITGLITGSFLFSGLMFGPDLDLPSCHYFRWGWLRWLWLPYQRQIKHRSVWSHGFLVGTVLRVIYLAGWIVLPLLGLAWGSQALGFLVVDWQQVGQGVQTWARSYCWEGLAIFVGLELGAMSHYSSDWLGSAWKRWQRPKHRVKHRPNHRSG